MEQAREGQGLGATATAAAVNPARISKGPVVVSPADVRPDTLLVMDGGPFDPNEGINALIAINAESQDFIAVRDLTLGAPYDILHVDAITTRYGRRIRADLRKQDTQEYCSVILPNRFARLSDTNVVGINILCEAGHFPALTYRGLNNGVYELDIKHV